MITFSFVDIDSPAGQPLLNLSHVILQISRCNTGIGMCAVYPRIVSEGSIYHVKQTAEGPTLWYPQFDVRFSWGKTF